MRIKPNRGEIEESLPTARRATAYCRAANRSESSTEKKTFSAKPTNRKKKNARLNFEGKRTSKASLTHPARAREGANTARKTRYE